MGIHSARVAFLLKELWTWVTRPIQLGVRMILIQDDKVLMVRHTYMPGWHFPGGHMNRGETPLEGAAREAWEEAGVELLEPPQFLGIFSATAMGRSDHVVVYVSRKFRVGKPTDTWEIAERKFFTIDAIPPGISERWRKIVSNLVAND
jgi:ADP-ribose pyrophosphatase YjhB (NUDIX family)